MSKNISFRLVQFGVMLLILASFQSNVFAQKMISIEGQILLPEGQRLAETGVSVVLLKFEKGTPMRGPQARIVSDASGKFRFDNVPQRLKASYRVGTRVAGKLYSSEAFTLKPDASVVQVNITVEPRPAAGAFPALPPQKVTSGETVSIEGEIQLPEGETLPETGASVVLLKFAMGPDGKIQGNGPQARIVSDASGKFRFEGVPQEFKVAYRLGTRVDGELYSSSLFSMKPGTSVIQVNIVIPAISENTEQLQGLHSNLFIEQGIGSVNLTEVLNILNMSENRIDTRKNPFIIDLPQSFTKFKALNGLSEEQFTISGKSLKITRVFPKSATQIVFQYTIPAWFGQTQIKKTYNHPLKNVQVLTPTKALSIESAELGFSGERQGNSMTFLAWMGASDSTGSIHLNVTGIPIEPVHYAVLALATFLLLMIAVVIFLKTRLHKKTTV